MRIGLVYNLGLVAMLKRPIARTPLETWTDLSPDDVKAHCDSLVWYLEQKEA